MTDDPNAQPEDLDAEAVDAPAVDAGDATDDDLDDAELEAAAERAKLEVDDEAGGADVDDFGGVEAAPLLASGGARLEPEVRGPRPRGPKPAEHTPYAVDPSQRIRDPWSAAFVAISVAVFGLILAYALLLGRGGALTPIPTPTPIPTVAPESVAPSSSVAPSTSVEPSGSIAPSGSPSGSPTPSEAPPTPVH
jgi:hypothetical protein